MPTTTPDPALTPPTVPDDGARRVIDYLRLLLEGNAAGQWSDADVLARMRQAIDGGVTSDGVVEPWPRPFADLRGPTGFLWLINRQVFHPWGYGLAIVLDTDGVALGWQLLGDGTEPWNFEDGTETDYMTAVRRLLDGAR